MNEQILTVVVTAVAVLSLIGVWAIAYWIRAIRRAEQAFNESHARIMAKVNAGARRTNGRIETPSGFFDIAYDEGGQAYVDSKTEKRDGGLR